MRLNPALTAFTLVPVVMMLLTIYAAGKKTDHECYAPLVGQIAGFLVLGLGIFGFAMEPSVVTLVGAIFFAFLFLFAAFFDIFTKIRFENEYIELITFGIKRKYEYRKIQRIEVKYSPNTQFKQEIIIVFPRKKIRIPYLFIGFSYVQDFLRERLKKNDLKIPWVHHKRGISKRKQQKQNRYRDTDNKMKK